MQFDIITYMGSLTGFTYERPVLERIAIERGVSEITEYGQLEQRDKDLVLADLLFVAYTSPYQTSSLTKQHGAFSQTIGSQIITDKKGIYNLMTALYKKWNDAKLETVVQLNGNVQWVNYSEDDCE